MNRPVALMLIASACAGEPPRPAPRLVVTPVVVGPHTRDALLERVSRARDLAIERPVERKVMTRAELLAALRDHVARTVPRPEIEGEGAFLHLVGILPADGDYEKLVYDALEASLAGMYEPSRGAMLLPDDLTPQARLATEAHELVHALQDQHFDLGKLEAWTPGDGDTMNARSCLAEGDATVAAAIVLGEESPLPDLSHASWVQRELVTPYIVGQAFVRDLRGHGGWAEVDEAWRRPDMTTEQVLHPEKWRAHERAESVPSLDVSALGPGATVTWKDTRGELELGLTLSAAVPDVVAASAATGWAGDTAIVVRAGASQAMGWRIRFDDEAHARASEPVLRQAFEARACHFSRQNREACVLFGPAPNVCAAWAKSCYRPGA